MRMCATDWKGARDKGADGCCPDLLGSVIALPERQGSLEGVENEENVDHSAAFTL